MAKKCKKGFRRKGNKCVKFKKKLFGSSRKTKNPFKMLGSYVGLVIGLLYMPWLKPLCEFIKICPDIWRCFYAGACELMGLAFIIMGMLGFLIGWIIQLLIRRFKK